MHDNNGRPDWKISGSATLALSGGLAFQRSATVTASPHKARTVVVYQPPALSRSRVDDKKTRFPKICLHAQWASLKTHAAQSKGARARGVHSQLCEVSDTHRDDDCGCSRLLAKSWQVKAIGISRHAGRKYRRYELIKDSTRWVMLPGFISGWSVCVCSDSRYSVHRRPCVVYTEV